MNNDRRVNVMENYNGNTSVLALKFPDYTGTTEIRSNEGPTPISVSQSQSPSAPTGKCWQRV